MEDSNTTNKGVQTRTFAFIDNIFLILVLAGTVAQIIVVNKIGLGDSYGSAMALFLTGGIFWIPILSLITLVCSIFLFGLSIKTKVQLLPRSFSLVAAVSGIVVSSFLLYSLVSLSNDERKTTKADQEVQQSQNQFVDGGEYVNEDFGYEIKYPTGYTLDDSFNQAVESSTRNITEIISNQVRIGITANKNRNSGDSECENVAQANDPRWSSVKLGSNTFDLIVANNTTTDLGNSARVMRNYYLKTSSSCYLISASYPPTLPKTTNDKLISEINGIVSTFTLKFDKINL